ncbi:MAG TPA: hypothetical protein VLA46_11975, partial [Saprospiraceae bacterium]|nr:hypothetical protein [Saprospiraceae bacterium]
MESFVIRISVWTMLTSLSAAISSFEKIAGSEYPVAGFVDVIILSMHQSSLGGMIFINSCILIFFQAV